MNLKAIDIAIAEKVFNQKPCDLWTATGSPFWGMKHDDSAHPEFGPCYPRNHPPEYSQNISAAWQVVEKMRERGFDAEWSSRPGLEYGCRIAPRGEFNTPNVKFEAAQTVTLACCLAALQALGVEIPE